VLIKYFEATYYLYYIQIEDDNVFFYNPEEECTLSLIA